VYEAARVDFFLGMGLDDDEAVAWLWPERVPLGMVTLLEGEGATGKSLIVADMAARVTTGAPWPGRVQGPQPAGGVLYCVEEDGWLSMIFPRLKAAGADCTRVGRLLDVDTCHPAETEAARAHTQRRLAFPADLAHLEYNLRIRPDVRLVIVDPLSSFCGDKKTYVAALRQLNEIAARRRVAIVVTGRPTGRRARNRMQITSDRRADAVRCVLHVLTDLEDETRFYLAPARMNFCAQPQWLAFRHGPGPQVAWEPPLESPPEEATANPIKEKAAICRAAMDWLQEMLHDEDALASVVQKNARRCGISQMTLRRAKEKLKVRSYKKGGGQQGWWMWTLRPKKTDSQGAAPGEPGRDPDSSPEEASPSMPAGHLQDESSPTLSDLLNLAAVASGGSDFDRFGRAILSELLAAEGFAGGSDENARPNGRHRSNGKHSSNGHAGSNGHRRKPK
jgi:hypothetical protein